MNNDWNFAARSSVAQVEEGDQLAPKFDDYGLIPCITRHAESGEILMFAYMNEEALRLSIDTSHAHYWSRSRQKLWKKGETSGMRQNIERILVDDDQDCVVLVSRALRALTLAREIFSKCKASRGSELTFVAEKQRSSWEKGSRDPSPPSIASKSRKLYHNPKLTNLARGTLEVTLNSPSAGGDEASCHVGYRSCFYREVENSNGGPTLRFIESEKSFDPNTVYGDTPNPTRL